MASDTEIGLFDVVQKSMDTVHLMPSAVYLKQWWTYILHSGAEERPQKNSVVLEFRN
jgi:hypothetical protein